MGYQFDGYNKLVILDSPDPFSISDLYSRWKDWVLDGNANFIQAFRTVGGDPISSGQVVAPYFFLNTLEGWKIRPVEIDHELRISGNLYSEDPNQSMFVPTLGDYTVNVIIERSSAAIGVESGGGGGLTLQQATWLEAIYKNIGLQTVLLLRK